MKKKTPTSFSKPEKAPRVKVFQSDFAKKVYAVVAKIPKGKTMTYKQVATKAGKPFAARAVGTIMSHNFNPKIPCHRVVRSDGKMGGYNRGGSISKLKILHKEGWRG
jgi:methylated-DNA-[protein]-cysteine S-methyltransferase